ncbi:MAG: hypothetical protein ABIJ08_03905 [Nanoarchaeota archaeon]
MAKEDESYEIMPYKEIVNLKKEIEALKKRSGDTSSQELINSMSQLTKSMDSMLQLFKTAAQEMSAEKSTEEKLGDKITPLMKRLDEVIEQNKTIAEGMVAIADIVKKEYKAGLPPRQYQPRREMPPISNPITPQSNPGLPDFGSFDTSEDLSQLGQSPGELPDFGSDFGSQGGLPPLGPPGQMPPPPRGMPQQQMGMPPPGRMGSPQQRGMQPPPDFGQMPPPPDFGAMPPLSPPEPRKKGLNKLFNFGKK